MSTGPKKTLLKYGITFSLAALLTAAGLKLNGYTGSLPPSEKYRILCDAFTIPGVMLMMLCALVALANEGSLDALSYAVRYAVRRLVPGNGGQKETYAEYLERKRTQRVRGYSFLFWVAIVFLAAAAVFLILFFKNEP